MPPIGKITILEFAPCADTICSIRRDPNEGYLSATDDEVRIRTGIRLRPQIGVTYAGGKATNVARVIDKLLEDADPVDVELVVFRPDSPEGRYLHELQTGELHRVTVRPVIVDATARFCINLSDPSSPGGKVEFNISPHPKWSSGAMDAAVRTAEQISTDLLLIAGNPPVLEPGLRPASDLPARVLQSACGGPATSVDTSGEALAGCLRSNRRPDVVKINREEFAAVSRDLWSTFKGILVVTDSNGCVVYQHGPDGPSAKVAAATVERVYSTVGAGDAAHAAITIALWVWGFDPVRAARFGMAAAAATVSSPQSTRGVQRETVQQIFTELDCDAD